MKQSGVQAGKTSFLAGTRHHLRMSIYHAACSINKQCSTPIQRHTRMQDRFTWKK